MPYQWGYHIPQTLHPQTPSPMQFLNHPPGPMEGPVSAVPSLCDACKCPPVPPSLHRTGSPVPLFRGVLSPQLPWL